MMIKFGSVIFYVGLVVNFRCDLVQDVAPHVYRLGSWGRVLAGIYARQDLTASAKLGFGLAEQSRETA